MVNDKKLKTANRISFIFFSLYLLTYIFLPIIEGNAYYLIFLFFPILFSISLIINLSIKYNNMNKDNMKKISKTAAIFNILFNGFNVHTIAGSSYVGTIDWDAKEEEIKKYPSITPLWLFIMLFCTALFNGVSLFWAFSPTENHWNLSGNAIIIASIISIFSILIGMISSSFALYYNNGKKETFRFWKIIAVMVIGLIIIAIYSAYASGFSIRDEIRRKNEKDTFERHKQNIERTLNNN